MEEGKEGNYEEILIQNNESFFKFISKLDLKVN